MYNHAIAVGKDINIRHLRHLIVSGKLHKKFPVPPLSPDSQDLVAHALAVSNRNQQQIQESTETEIEDAVSTTAVGLSPYSLPRLGVDHAKQIAQFELDESSDSYFTQGFPQLL